MSSSKSYDQILQKLNLLQINYDKIKKELVQEQSLNSSLKEKLEAENALVELESMYDELIETSLNLIWRCDREGRFTYLSKPWEDLLEYDLSEMIGRKTEQDWEQARRITRLCRWNFLRKG